jgi:hemoglobin
MLKSLNLKSLVTSIEITVAYVIALSVVATFALALPGTASAQAQNQAAPASKDDSVFQGLGGKQGISTFTKDFVQMIIKDARISAFFVDTDVDRLEGLLSEQFCELSGGPCKYSGRDMKTVHAGMGVRPSHFNALAENLQFAMDKHKVPFNAQNALIAKLAPMHRDINNQPAQNTNNNSKK